MGKQGPSGASVRGSLHAASPEILTDAPQPVGCLSHNFGPPTALDEFAQCCLLCRLVFVLSGSSWCLPRACFSTVRYFRPTTIEFELAREGDSCSCNDGQGAAPASKPRRRQSPLSGAACRTVAARLTFVTPLTVPHRCHPPPSYSLPFHLCTHCFLAQPCRAGVVEVASALWKARQVDGRRAPPRLPTWPVLQLSRPRRIVSPRVKCALPPLGRLPLMPRKQWRAPCPPGFFNTRLACRCP